MFDFIKKSWTKIRIKRKLRHNGALGVKGRRVQDVSHPRMERSRILGVVLLVVLWAVATALLSFPRGVPTDYKMVVGQTAPYYIPSKIAFSYENPEATMQAQSEALADAPLYYEISSAKSDLIRRKFNTLFQAVNARAVAESSQKEYRASDEKYLQQVADLPADDFRVLNASVSGNALKNFESERDTLIGQGIFAFEDKAAQKVGQKIRIVDLAGRERAVKLVMDIPDGLGVAKILAEKISDRKGIADLFKSVVGDGGNLAFSKKLTDAGNKRIIEETPPVIVEYSRGDVLVKKGQVADKALLNLIDYYSKEELKHFQQIRDYKIIAHNALFSFILVLFVGFYIYHIHKEVINSNKNLALLGGVTIVSLLINYGAIELFYQEAPIFELSSSLVINFIPFTLASVILVVILGFRISIYAGFLVSAILAIMTGSSFETSFGFMVVCSLSALAVRSSANYRSYFIRIFWSVSVLSWILNSNVLSVSHDIKLVMKSGLLSMANGFITAIAAQLIIFFLELACNVSTKMSLLLLLDYSHPLLERLKREAPGTFFHSLMVSTLAEDAAKAVKANALKAKCGALFHDIGKLSKPQYFTENNLENENQHLALNPQVSSIIIRDHVDEGLELAHKYKLNRIIRDAISQHHGNDLVHYFYNIASTKPNAAEYTESQFRYHGMPPHDKEMVIISLADACEAAVRSLEKPTASKIEAVVDEIFRKRFKDNQLIDADITLRELKIVRDSFVANLVSMKHGRIAYHKEENNDESDLFMAQSGHGGTAGASGSEKVY